MESNESMSVDTSITAVQPPLNAQPNEQSSAQHNPTGRGLETKGAHAWFGNHHALADVSLKFPAKTVTGLIGPSGCGKSTYIRLLNRMHEHIPGAAMAGQVLLDGQDIYAPEVDPSEIRLRVGMVFQKPNPFPSMTIKENVLSGIKLAHLKRSNHDEIVEQCLTSAGLWNEVKDRLGASGGSLSGGQQQRVSLARALAQDADILLADEPVAALDPVTAREVMDDFKRINQELNKTVLINIHHVELALEYRLFVNCSG